MDIMDYAMQNFRSSTYILMHAMHHHAKVHVPPPGLATHFFSIFKHDQYIFIDFHIYHFIYVYK